MGWGTRHQPSSRIDKSADTSARHPMIVSPSGPCDKIGSHTNPTIEYDHTPFCKGARGEWGEPLEPDDEEEFIITKLEIGKQDASEFLEFADFYDKLHEAAIESLQEV